MMNVELFNAGLERKISPTPNNRRNSSKRQPEDFFTSDDEEAKILPSTYHRSQNGRVRWDNQSSELVYLSDVSGLQAIVLRQSAALELSKLFDKLYSLDKLMRIAEGKKGEGFWSRLFNKKKSYEGVTFGTPLDILVNYHGVDSVYGFGSGTVRIPSVIEKCIESLKSQGICFLTRFICRGHF
jgi:hypothetical protein